MNLVLRNLLVLNYPVHLIYYYFQLQLSKSLSKVISKEKSLPTLVKVGQIPAISLPPLPASAPVVRLTHEDTQHGLLTPRQKTWVEGFPNDPYTENPVLYK